VKIAVLKYLPLLHGSRREEKIYVVIAMDGNERENNKDFYKRRRNGEDGN